MTGAVVDIKAAGARVLRYLGAMRSVDAVNAYADMVEVVKANTRMAEELRQLAGDRALLANHLRVIAAADQVRDAHRRRAPKQEQFAVLEVLFDVITVPLAAPKARGKK